MMSYYFVKSDLHGLPAGSIERFAPSHAGPLSVSGQIEPYDEKNKTHAAAKARIERETEKQRLAAEADLQMEREHPKEWAAEVLRRRKAADAENAKRLKTESAYRREMDARRDAK